jgi:hypothetical protein
LGKKHFKGILLVLTVLTMTLFAVGVASAATNNVLLVQDTNPWGSTANFDVLDSLGYNYTVSNMEDISDTNLANYKLVILANSQSSNFYDGYADNQTKFESYVKNGGVLLFGTCDQSGTQFYANAPGGVDHFFAPEYNNYIVDYSNPVVTGELTGGVELTDADLVGSWCNHDVFDESTLPDGAMIILRGSSSDDPTLVMYKYGKGKVVGSGLTWEWAYGQSEYPFANIAMDDLFAYAMSLGGRVSSGHDSLPGHISFSSHTGFDH